MKTKLSGIITLFLALFVQLSFAQERTITGNVSDESGPLPGVSVLIEGTTTGTETDFDGNYSITANSGDVLRFSFVGMTTVTRSVGAESTINVTMVSETNTLDEVVVTALGIKKEKKALGYATTQVDGEVFEDKAESDVARALQGQSSGVNIISQNGLSGSGTNVIIRGDDITVQGINLEDVSQTAANIQNATKIRRKDPRVFLDGIYVYEKHEGNQE